MALLYFSYLAFRHITSLQTGFAPDRFRVLQVLVASNFIHIEQPDDMTMVAMKEL